MLPFLNLFYHEILSHLLSYPPTPLLFLVIHGSPQQASVGVSLITFWGLPTQMLGLCTQMLIMAIPQLPSRHSSTHTLLHAV